MTFEGGRYSRKDLLPMPVRSEWNRSSVARPGATHRSSSAAANSAIRRWRIDARESSLLRNQAAIIRSMPASSATDAAANGRHRDRLIRSRVHASERPWPRSSPLARERASKAGSLPNSR